MNEATMEWLTAAECALRTGLTVRALRVYENYGLITPGRQDARLMLEPIGQPVLELEQTGEADCAIRSSISCCASNRSKTAPRSGW
jgi:hypothetical protein